MVGSTGVSVGKRGNAVCVAVGATAVGRLGVKVGATVADAGCGVRVGVGKGVRVRAGGVVVVPAPGAERGVGDVGVEAARVALVAVGCGLVVVGADVGGGTLVAS